jgi:hypothetical protein
LSSAVLLLGETSELNVTGSDVYIATLKRDKDALYTATINVEEFSGRIYLQGSLAKNPSSADWFNIKINNKRYIDYPLDPANPRGTIGDTAADKFNFAGNFLHIRAVVDKTVVSNPSGKIIQILLSDEFSTELHNDAAGIIIKPDPGTNGPGIGIQKFEFATVTVDSQGHILRVEAGDPTKISAQTYVITSYAALSNLKPQPGDTALVDSSSDPLSGYYIYTGTGWKRIGVNVSLIDTNSTISDQIDQIGTIRFDVDSGFDVKDLGQGTVKVGMNSTFKYWKVDGQTDLVAKGLDTVKFIAGDGVSITTDPTADIKSIKFSSTNDLQKTVTINPSSSSVLLGNFPTNARIKKIIVEVSQEFGSCEFNVLAGENELISADEISLDAGDISVFELNKLLLANSDCTVSVNNFGSVTGEATVRINFSLEQ